MNCGTWFWEKGQSPSQSGRERTPGADCEDSWPVVPDQNQDWSGSPVDCDPQRGHSPRQNYRKRQRQNAFVTVYSLSIKQRSDNI